MNLASPNDLRLSDAHRQACRHTLSSAALPEAHAEVCAAGANGTNIGQWWSARSNALTNNSNSSKGYHREG